MGWMDNNTHFSFFLALTVCQMTVRLWKMRPEVIMVVVLNAEPDTFRNERKTFPSALMAFGALPPCYYHPIAPLIAGIEAQIES